MMTPPPESQSQPPHVTDAVRRNVWPAAIAAGLMGYYGYRFFARPDVTDLLTLSNLVFYYTLRIGAVLMAAVAVWCWTGRLLALAVDAGVSSVIGVLFVVSGGGMLIDGGASFNAVLIMLFGVMFFTAGRNNWRAYAHLSRGGRVTTFENEMVAAPPAATRPAEAPLRDAPPVEAAWESDDAESQPPPANEEAEDDDPAPPPEGFLAAMSRKPPPTE